MKALLLSPMKVLLTGASGLVGHAAMHSAIARGHEVFALGHGRMPPLPVEAVAKGRVRALQADLTNEAAIERLVFDYYPDAIINAAALSNNATVEAAPELGEKLNIALPRRLAELSHHLSAKFLHLSTDAVFNGESGPYRSTDMPDPRTLYGQQKLEAEKEVLRAGGDTMVVLRITIVNGNSPSGRRSIHEKLFHAWANGQMTPLHTDELRQPVSADNVGDVLTELLERPNLHGLFHWAGPDSLTRFEIGQALLKHFKLPENLIRPIKRADLPGGEKHPRALEFILPPLLGKLTAKPTPFEFQLEELQVPAEHQDWYRKTRLAGSEAPARRLVQGRDF
jgi:dTDP-4-dehydrorhamnose reductase